MIDKSLNYEELHIVTHSHQFNLDELFAIVLIQLYINPNTVITRTRDEKLLTKFKNNPTVWVLDVGREYDPDMKNFDHHQADFNKTWKNGEPKSTCGIVWDYLKENNLLAQHMNKETIKAIEEHIIMKVDREDNGIEKWVEATFINLFNRQTNNPDTAMYQFNKALTSAREFFKNMFGFIRGKMKAENEVKRIIKNSEKHDFVLVFNSNNRYALNEISNHSDKKIAVIPHESKTQFKILGLRPKNGQSQVLMPKHWRGLFGDELKKISQVPELHFCHKDGFMCVVETNLEKAIELANKVYLYNIS